MEDAPLAIEIVPHSGIGPIKLGASRDETRDAMRENGLPLCYERGSLDYFCDNAIQAEYGEDDRVDFIGVSHHPKIAATYDGAPVFAVPAESLFDLISANEDVRADYNPDEHLFDRQIVTLWEADSQYDYAGGESRPVWAQVGVGNERYLAAIREINTKQNKPAHTTPDPP